MFYLVPFLPTKKICFALSPDEFRNAVALRYQFTPIGIPSTCDGCSEDFDLCHAVNCKKGGLVIHWHNEMCNLNCVICSLTGLSQVISKPLVKQNNDDDDELEGLRVVGLLKLLGFSKNSIVWCLHFQCWCLFVKKLVTSNISKWKRMLNNPNNVKQLKFAELLARQLLQVVK